MSQLSSSSPARSSEPVVNPAIDSRLDQLTAEYAQLKAQMEPLKERLENTTAAIKTELAEQLQGGTSILLTSPHLMKPLRYEMVTSWNLDIKTLKTVEPAIYVRYANKRETWKLGPVR